MEHKCNSTSEVLCGVGVRDSPKALEGALNTTTAAETTTLLDNEMASFSQCQNIASSNFGTWLFLLGMTAIMVIQEAKYRFRVRLLHLVSLILHIHHHFVILVQNLLPSDW